MVPKLVPGMGPAVVEALAASRSEPPQLGTDLWVLAALTRLLPNGSGIVRRADIAAVVGRHISAVSRSMNRLAAARLITHEPMLSVSAPSDGSGGGVEVEIQRIDARQRRPLADPTS